MRFRDYMTRAARQTVVVWAGFALAGAFLQITNFPMYATYVR